MHKSIELSNNTLRVQTETEHMDIYGIIDSLRKNTGNNDLLKKLADILEKHVRFEERELFNYLQANIPESTLLEIASLLRSRKHEPDSA